MNRGVSCLTGNTSFTFGISAGWSNSRMCSKTSEGSSDIEAGDIANSIRVVSEPRNTSANASSITIGPELVFLRRFLHGTIDC